jgi:hypothetical protein
MTARKPGSALIAERFPNATILWTLDYGNENGWPFTVTAYSINGRVVLLQQFGESRGNTWDVYVPASDSGKISDTLDALEARVQRAPLDAADWQVIAYALRSKLSQILGGEYGDEIAESPLEAFGCVGELRVALDSLLERIPSRAHGGPQSPSTLQGPSDLGTGAANPDAIIFPRTPD